MIERIAANSDKRDANTAEYDQSEKDRSKNDKEFLHIGV